MTGPVTGCVTGCVTGAVTGRARLAALVLALALAGCTADDDPPVLDALPSTPVCATEETPESCLDGVRLSLQSAFTAVTDQGTVTRADYERVLGSVVSQERLGDAFSYALLTEPGDGADPADAIGPTQFRVSVGDAVGTWWLCPQDGRVSTATCDEQR